MKIVAFAVAFACLTSSALAQTNPQAAPPVGVASATCSAFTPPPAPLDAATATPAQMTAADQAYQTWRQQNVVVLECRRAQYNEAVGAMNAANTAWGATVQAYCGRRNMHCQAEQHADPSTQTPVATPTP